MEVYTIGFTQARAAEFFGKLTQASIHRLVDVRLNNVSQLAGFAKRDDLQYFLSEICAVEYIHEPLLAPSKEVLDIHLHCLQRRFAPRYGATPSIDFGRIPSR